MAECNDFEDMLSGAADMRMGDTRRGLGTAIRTPGVTPIEHDGHVCRTSVRCLAFGLH